MTSYTSTKAEVLTSVKQTMEIAVGQTYSMSGTSKVVTEIVLLSTFLPDPKYTGAYIDPSYTVPTSDLDNLKNAIIILTNPSGELTSRVYIPLCQFDSLFV